MKHLVFENNNGDYEVHSFIDEKYAASIMLKSRTCVAAFLHQQDAENFVHEYNNMWR